MLVEITEATHYQWNRKNTMRSSRLLQRYMMRFILASVLIVAVLCLGSLLPSTPNANTLQQVRRPATGVSKLKGRSSADESTTRSASLLQVAPSPEQRQLELSSAELNGAEHILHPSGEAIDAVLHHMETAFEDEYRLNALLSPITQTGEDLLRDLAHRVRAFRAMFSTWEDLNVVLSDGLHPPSFTSRLRLTATSSNSVAQAIRTYDKFRHFIHLFSKRLFPWTMLSYPDHMSLHMSFYGGGRGIVFTAGNNQAQQLLTIIPSLREIGCDLPIEVMYLGNEDLDEEMQEMLEGLEGVVTRDLRLMIDDDGWRLAGWAAKPFAILMSSFREAMFIDADSFFFVDPTTLFDTPEYSTTGALFFKDRNLQPEDKQAWIRAVLPSPISAKVKQNRMWTGESGHMQESGVLVVDKYRHFIPLLLTTRLNGPDRDGDQESNRRGVYDMMYGDKESFWLSWEMAGDLDYAFWDGVTGTMGPLTPTNTSLASMPVSTAPAIGSTICSPQLLHFDKTGHPLWFNGWVSTSKDDLKSWQEFDLYSREPEETGRKPNLSEVWKIGEANVVCLEAVHVFSFTEKEKSTLNAILDRAKANDAILTKHSSYIGQVGI